LLSGNAIAEPRYPELERLQGAWVPEEHRCEKVFFRQGRSINFYRPGASVREGILVQENHLSDARHRCVISKVKQHEESYTMLVTCLGSRSLITSKLSLSMKFEDENRVVRTFSAFPEENSSFVDAASETLAQLSTEFSNFYNDATCKQTTHAAHVDER
jgi:hypothetical protein